MGWDIVTSLQEGRRRGIADNVWSAISDADQLRAARNLDRILLSLDNFQGKDGAEVAAELVLNGGRIVQIAGGTAQTYYRSLAKLLWHFDEWMPFLRDQPGVVELHDLRRPPTTWTVESYSARTVRSSSRTVFDDYIAKWKTRELEPIAPRPVLAPEARLLMKELPEPPAEA